MDTKSKYNYHCEYDEQERDNVNSPSHYQGKVECIDCIESATAGLNGIEAFCTGNGHKIFISLEKEKWHN